MLFDKSIRDKAVKSACGKKKKAIKSSVKKFKVAASTGKVQYTKKSVTAAESYGWVVEDHQAWEAYEFACDYFGKEYLDDQIVSGLSSEELAASLAFIFRMNEFREWEDYINGDGEDDEDEVKESVRCKGRKSVTAAKRPVTAMRITKDFSEFQPWSGAVDTWNTLMEYDKLDLFEQILDTTFINNEGEGIMDETELNDLLWFEPETVYEWVGLYYNDETGEVSDEPFDTDDED